MAERPEVFNSESTAYTVFPIYLVVDVSESMGKARDGGRPPIDILNEEYQGIIRELKRSPLVRETAQVCVITFSTDAAVASPLGQLDADLEFFAGGVTRYTKAFRLLRLQIERDMVGLAQQNRAHYRPTVFFLTDGRPEPEDEVGAWPQDHGPLVDPSFRYHPHIFALGFGGADPKALGRIASGNGRAFIADGTRSQSEDLVAILEQIKFSVFNPSDGLLTVNPTPGLREIRFGSDLPS